MTTHILLPTHNRPELLDRCLNSLAALGSELSDVTIQVLENGSEVAAPIVNQYRDRLPVDYHHYAQGNKSLALNAATAGLPAEDLLVFLDDDVAVHPGTFTAFQTAANRFGPGHYFGGVLHPDFEQQPAPDVRPYLPPEARMMDFSQGEEAHRFHRFQFFMGACWACFSGDLAKAGHFDSNFGPGAKSKARGQETDTQLRLFQLGAVPVGLRDAVADHYVPARAVSPDYVVDRIYKAMIHPGERQATLITSLGLLAKLGFSVLLLPLAPHSVGHRYRISKGAGYFRGLSQRGRK